MAADYNISIMHIYYIINKNMNILSDSLAIFSMIKI